MTSPMVEPRRILVAKPGLDGHDRGAKVVAMALRNAGFEVIYTGLHQTPEIIVETAIQEDVQFIGLSILSGAHLGLTGKVVEQLKLKGCEDIKVIVGGLIPFKDIEKLEALGVKKVFPSDTPLKEIADWFKENS